MLRIETWNAYHVHGDAQMASHVGDRLHEGCRQDRKVIRYDNDGTLTMVVRRED